MYLKVDKSTRDHINALFISYFTKRSAEFISICQMEHYRLNIIEIATQTVVKSMVGFIYMHDVPLLRKKNSKKVIFFPFNGSASLQSPSINNLSIRSSKEFCFSHKRKDIFTKNYWISSHIASCHSFSPTYCNSLEPVLGRPRILLPLLMESFAKSPRR